MAFVTSKEIMLKAQAGKYAVGAFNIENMEMAQAVIAVAQELHAPVILQTTPSTVRYGTLPVYTALIKTLANQVEVPVALHLDHGSSFELSVQAIKEGYTSIMIDGSHHSLEDNIAVTKRVVEVAKPNNIPVEAELGKVGGKEDDLDVEEDTNTVPAEAVRFANETGIDFLAVAIGTAHGFYQGEPNIDVDRLSEIKSLVSIPLVLHGASGVSDEIVKECISRGICKVNFATDLRVAFTNGIKEVLADNPETFDPKKLGVAGIEKVKELTRNKILLCGCDNKA